ncbi:uncharacterized protein LOC131665468 isoform X2 [Phymastichus coffea]|uniref:uncharacterized protein LOC131665468 isoform X2 n=1 Tax=Phymastichus coffea TaxID=108790 RepID=UPI00273CAB75|nr:uncharacterized protein LOC131665468 isoform X2 [Phymastichus coffea]
MDYQSRYPVRSNSDLQSQSKKHLLGSSFDENKQNHSFRKICSTEQSLSVDSLPKRDGFWQSLTKSARNLLGNHLNSTSSILKSWSNMNTPLSVTVVSPDLYKSLQGSKDQQMISSSKNFSATFAWIKEINQTRDYLLSHDLIDTEIMSNNMEKDTVLTDAERQWYEYKCMYINCNELKTKDQDCIDSIKKNEIEELTLDFAQWNKDFETLTNFSKSMKVDELVTLGKAESPMFQAKQQQEFPDISGNMANTLFTTRNKLINCTCDLHRRPTSPDSTVFMNRASHSKPMRLKKLHSVSLGRGRGRGKSQLRRSGVSQKRHRKEQERYTVEENIKNDIDTWEEVECDEGTDEDQLDNIDECDFVKDTTPSYDLSQEMCAPIKFEQVETESSSSEDEGSKDEDNECDDGNSFRSRLNSCNSEDSYSIIFDEDAPYHSSESDSSGSESESESEVDSSSKKVRFNLVPTIHRMITWKFAYKAARKNEDYANSQQFRCRIARTARVLDPILKQELRNRIYHERFEE